MKINAKTPTSETVTVPVKVSSVMFIMTSNSTLTAVPRLTHPSTLLRMLKRVDLSAFELRGTGFSIIYANPWPCRLAHHDIKYERVGRC